jgi:hypothetical protein
MKRLGWFDTITGYAGFTGYKRFRTVRAALPLLATLALLLAAAPPAVSQAVTGLGAVQGLRTERFDIYFPASLEAEGRRLASFADSVYADLEAYFSPAESGATGAGNAGAAGDADAAKAGPAAAPAWKIDVPGGRIPVLLSEASYDLNGYYTAYPSNRIVIYAKGAGARGSLASMDDELRSVFVHELTHLVTMNTRAPFWSFLARVLGDVSAPPAWIMPNSLLEGTAVWVESRYRGGLLAAVPGTSAVAAPAAATLTATALPASGRLHDPAALEAVFADILAGRRRGSWETAGLADFPGAGNLPYIYGALFAEYLESAYGAGIIRDLWGAAAEGNLFEGFEGTLTSKGLLEKRTGKTPKALWAGFLDWLEARAKAAEGAPAADMANGAGTPASVPAAALSARPAAAPAPAAGTPLASGRIAAFCVAGDTLYYLEGKRRAVLSLDLGKPGVRPRFVFSADPYLEAMRPSPDGKGLELDWVRPGPGEIPKPARYEYSFATGKLSLAGDRDEESMGSARANLSPGAPAPFLFGSAADPATGIRYGLVRMGTLVAPARVLPNGGGMEVLRSPLAFVRSLALGGGRLVLGAALPDGLSRIAILDIGAAGDAASGTTSGREVRLFLQKAAYPGGAALPAPSSDSSIIYRAELSDGLRELRLAPADPAALTAGYDRLEAAWVPLEDFRAALAAAEPYAAASPSAAAPAAPAAAALKPTLFPRLAATTRYPYLSQNSAGLVVQGQDLTERLSWEAQAGLRWDVGLPEEALDLTLLLGGQRLTLSASDRAAGAQASPNRLTALRLSHAFWHSFIPLQNTIWTNASAQFAGLQSNYAIGDFFAPAYGYASFAGSASAGFTTLGEEPFAPFDERGVSLQAGADGEILTGIGRTIALKAALTLASARPGLRLSLYGAWSPDESALFSPTGRSVASGGSGYLSALSIPYPAYGEYAGAGGGSPWYAFGEASARLASVDLWRKPGPIALPFMPGLAIRRLSLFGGLRGALLEHDGNLAAPTSAYARAEALLVPLAGLGAETTLSGYFEAAWAFDTALSGGASLFLSYGFGATL